MPTVNEVIRRLLPKGTNPAFGTHRAVVKRDYSKAPFWPPDVFAVTATMVEQSGCYARPRFVGWTQGNLFIDENHLQTVRDTAKEWQVSSDVPNEVARRWQILQDHGDAEVTAESETAHQWWDAAIMLMLIADQACAGMGFVDTTAVVSGVTNLGQNSFATVVLNQYEKVIRAKALRQAPESLALPNPSKSLCLMVPRSEVCVQPKTMTVQAGCTLRSLTHHLALLPGFGEVETEWFIGVHSKSDPDDRALNLLLIPFPYLVRDGCFSASGHCAGSAGSKWYDGDGSKSRFFSVNQNWLGAGSARLMADELTRFILDLILQAEDGIRDVHGVVLPELALHRPLAERIARSLSVHRKLEFFVCGTASDEKDKNKNSVFTSIFSPSGEPTNWEQAKHHRWKLERHQIIRYRLDDVLNPDFDWWEQIDVSPRQCNFYVFRHGACLAALVCEDLARIDPVQNVIRAVGPNLVIALLMDGPQKEWRWSGRYATVLADDPGSSVLTLTSLGLIRRSAQAGQPADRGIGLWKEAGGSKAQELDLPEGVHALLLTTWPVWETKFSLDGRSDQAGTAKYSLTGVRNVTHPSPPTWID